MMGRYEALDYPSKGSSTPYAARSGRWRLLCFALAVALWIYSFFPVAFLSTAKEIPKAKSKGDGVFDWAKITPTKHLEFHPCYEHFECARLDVPLDWQDVDGPRAAMALSKLPATVDVTSDEYGGAVLINPGGPGGSGVHMTFTTGEMLRQIFDSADRKFDVIGFDPRGVNHSTPSASCFPDDQTRREWDLEGLGVGMPQSNESLALVWSRGKALADTCARALGTESGNGLGPHVNTAAVATDMVALVERIGEWREQEAQRLTMSVSSPVKEEIRQRTRWQKGEEKLIYWGMSYGTTLGGTFAAMYPDRIGRMILDGVMEVNEYYKGNELPHFDNTDDCLQDLFKYCFAAGPAKCPFYDEAGVEFMNATFWDIAAAIKKTPIAVPGSGAEGPNVVTFSDLIGPITSATYSPFKYIEKTMQILADISKGNGTSLAKTKKEQKLQVWPSQKCVKDGPFADSCYEHEVYVSQSDVTKVIWAADYVDDLPIATFDDAWTQWQEMKNLTRLAADRWAQSKSTTRQLKLHSKLKVNGRIEGKTATPILFIGNTHDPITPLNSAKIMSAEFPGSVVLQQNCTGHASVAGPSLCTAKYIQEYFKSATLPPANTVCQLDRQPYDDTTVASFSNPAEKDLHLAMARLGTEMAEFFRSISLLT